MATYSPGPCRHTGAAIGVAMTLMLVGTACSSSSSRGEAADLIPSSTSSAASATDASAAGDGPATTEAAEATRVVGREQLDVSSVNEQPGVLAYRPGTAVDADLRPRERLSGPIAYMTFGEPDSGLVIVEPDGTEPRSYPDLKDGIFPSPAWPGLVALRTEGEVTEWFDVATGTRVQRPDNTLSELSGGYEVAIVVPPRESQSLGLSGPQGAFEMDEGWLPWSVEGSTVLAISVDVEREIVIGVGAFAVTKDDELSPVHLFETPDGVSILDVWLDRSGRSIFAVLTDGSETWIETVAFDRPEPRRLEFEGFSVDEESIVVPLSPDSLVLNIGGMVRGVDLSAGTVTEAVPFAGVLAEWHHGLVLWTEEGFAVMTTGGSYESLDIPTAWAAPIRDREELDPEALWFSGGVAAFPFWVLNTATGEVHGFDPAEDPALEPTSPTRDAVVGADGRLYVPSDEGMWVLAPDGSYENVEGAFGRLEMSPSGDHFVSTRDTLVNGRRESLPSIIVLDLDGRVLAEFGEGDFPVWTHGQPQS